MWAAAGTVVIVVAFVAWMELEIGGQRATIAVDDIGEAVAALVAATCCGLAARRGIGRQRLGWALLSLSALSWGLGEIVWSAYEVGLGVDVPYPGAPDVGFLGAIPLAVAGMLAFFSTPRGSSTRLRLWLDGTIVLLALFFVAWTLGLKAVYEDADSALAVKLVNMAYPIGDILIGAVLVLAIRRAKDEAQGTLLFLLGGLAAISLADSAFAYLTASGNYGAIGSVLDVGWVAGYLMIALAALLPTEGARKVDEAGKEQVIDMWQLALPWVAVLGVGVTFIGMAFTGAAIGPVRTVLAGALTILIMVSQVYAHSESRSLLIQSRLAAATLNDIVNHAPLGVVRLALDLRIIQANPRFSVLLRRPDMELIGASLASFLPPDQAAEAAAQFRSLSEDSTGAIESETEALRGDGTNVWLHWSATAVLGGSGETDYFIAMFNDTTARHEAEVAAVANVNVLERLNRLKNEFLTMVRHEFRTALVGIEAFSELMRDADELDLPAVKSFASDINDDAHRLGKVLDTMLDLDRADGARGEIRLVATDLGATVRQAVLTAEAMTPGLRITNTVDSDLPSIAGDPGLLAELLRILFDNAIKYSPARGAILVSGRAEPGQVLISIKDHGVGMPESFDDQLFARYQWTANNPTTKVMGTGLGLPMARQIVEMHGGRIWFESESGIGSEFHFSLPIQINRSAPHELQPAPALVA